MGVAVESVMLLCRRRGTPVGAVRSVLGLGLLLAQSCRKLSSKASLSAQVSGLGQVFLLGAGVCNRFEGASVKRRGHLSVQVNRSVLAVAKAPRAALWGGRHRAWTQWVVSPVCGRMLVEAACGRGSRTLTCPPRWRRPKSPRQDKRAYSQFARSPVSASRKVQWSF